MLACQYIYILACCQVSSEFSPNFFVASPFFPPTGFRWPITDFLGCDVNEAPNDGPASVTDGAEESADGAEESTDGAVESTGGAGDGVEGEGSAEEGVMD